MKKISKNAIVILIIAIAAVVALVLVYLNGKKHYEDRFFQGTIINGWDCTDETVEDVKTDRQAEILNYKLTIEERGGKTETITGRELTGGGEK